jgi:hypothetical protein
VNNLNACTSLGGNRRLNVGLWLLVASLFCFAGAAAQTYTKQNSRVARFQLDTTFDPASPTTATAVRASAFIDSKRLVNDANPNDVIDGPWTQVNFDLLDPALANTPITAGGVTLSGYAKLAALIRQASLDRANAAP